MKIELTRAQRAFLTQLRCFRAGHGFDFDVLSGSEMAMARRLEASGFVRQHSATMQEPCWVITDAGRAALEQGS